MSEPKLTLLVCLKDRADFTKRLCAYLSAINYSYPVYFADGSINNENELFFETLKNQNFNYTYSRYPQDQTLLDYYTKCKLAVSAITTPYVMLADNDDFPIQAGQAKAIQFLELNPEFVACNGRVAGISVKPDAALPKGRNLLLHELYCQTMDAQVNLGHDAALDRIESYLTNFYSIFYSVFKTEVLVSTFSEIERLNPSELGIHELFFSYMFLAQGKVQSIAEITYIRQKGSSQIAVTQKDWFHRLFYTNWLHDCKQAINVVAEHIATKEHLPQSSVYDTLYAKLVARMRARYIPNDMYWLKNCNFSDLVARIFIIVTNKILRKFPSLAEKNSIKLCSTWTSKDNLLAIKNIIVH